MTAPAMTITLQLHPFISEINPGFPDSLLSDHPLDLAFLYREEWKVNFPYRDSYKCIKSKCPKTSGVIKYFIDTTQVTLLGFTLSFTHLFEWCAFLCIYELRCVWLHLYVRVFRGAILNWLSSWIILHLMYGGRISHGTQISPVYHFR